MNNRNNEILYHYNDSFYFILEVGYRKISKEIYNANIKADRSI